ncbi:MAG: glycine--tRNA ligase [Candidatus Taylorbacteria bacterium RIFCSPHIGHO2_01_FULL_51_15]|uniref:Glycine--tRNA ligase n=1 Tax=Candidatus Taylorbacteria bacterium RIFCSPHIGHO2_01_FULL_51_15 TaxID=1802304 RepID=A0A1G2M9C6_9BACT|nr:MAG: glycine--tRNA ligase [Candidatus Taylorbacteria bacterium RIFCSPHIGHO2_01_FULL_51_15]
MADIKENIMEKIVALCKRRGFIYQGSEIYGGLSGTWDYGPLGVELKNNIRDAWWRFFVRERDDMYGIDSAILMNSKVWEASGHVGGFADPMVECKKCKRRFREDSLDTARDKQGTCPECAGALGDVREFNMMFKTHVGATEDDASVSYLRPETAQGMFVNFKNVIDSFHPKLPFGIAQVGKAFRNEIAPRDFTFRSREFEIMEFEYFIREADWEKQFEYWQSEMMRWIEIVGIGKGNVHEVKVPNEELAHYSKRTTDLYFDFPFGQKELYGLAYRTDFDLKNHSAASGTELLYSDEENKTPFTPHVIEPTFGLDRTVLAVLCSAYTEDEMGGEKRIYLKFKPSIAPIKVAVFPLLRNKPELVKKAREVYELLCSMFHGSRSMIAWDESGNIGKRYRRQDEIGTPFCITVDFDSLEKGDVTVRERDTGKQERVRIDQLESHLREIFEH